MINRSDRRMRSRSNVPSIINVREGYVANRQHEYSTPCITKMYTCIDQRFQRYQPIVKENSANELSLCKKNFFPDGNISPLTEDFDNSLTHLTTEGTDGDDLTEENLLQEIMYYFQGVDGKIIEYSELNGYKINENVNLNDKVHLILYILEHGLLSIQIGHLLEKQKVGIIEGGLFSAVRDILVQFHKEINLISFEEKDVCGWADLSNPGLSPVSLKQALCWARGSVLPLVSIITVLKEVAYSRGGPILNPLTKILNHGNKNLYPSMFYLFKGGNFPLMNMIKKWLTAGEINDEYNEFFIMKNPSCSDKYTLSNHFIIRDELKPMWVGENLAHLILNVGSLVHLVKNFSDKSERVVVIAKEIYYKIDAICNSGPVEIDQIKNNQLPFCFKVLYEELSQEAFNTLSTSCNIQTQLKLIHGYVLLGKGNFATNLVKKIQEELATHKSNVNGLRLSKILSTTVRKTISKGEEFILDTLETQLFIDGTAFDPTIDFFCIRYKADGLIKMILQPFLDVYTKIFSFLWKIKECENMLKNLRKLVVWKFKKYKNKDLDLLTNDLIFVSNHLYIFTMSLQYYMVTHVIDKNWNEFTIRYNESKSMDEAVKAHGECLKSILVETMQNRKSKNTLLSITLILNLVKEVEEIGEQLSKILLEVEKGQKVTFYGLLLIKAKIEIIMKSYQKTLTDLLTQRNQKKFEIFQEIINFNEYYHKRSSNNYYRSPNRQLKNS